MSRYVYDVTIAGEGIPTVLYLGLTAHQLRHVVARAPVRSERTVRPRDTARPTRLLGGRWV